LLLVSQPFLGFVGDPRLLKAFETSVQVRCARSAGPCVDEKRRSDPDHEADHDEQGDYSGGSSRMAPAGPEGGCATSNPCLGVEVGPGLAQADLGLDREGLLQ
jgi:hypothetical protein